jgi:adenylate cyclase
MQSLSFQDTSGTNAELRVVLFCDLVESVRLIAFYEDYVIDRWIKFSNEVRNVTSSEYGGLVIKSTGDGLLLEFNDSVQAVLAAMKLHALIETENLTEPKERHLRLRIGIHQSLARRDAYDLYGHGVNLTARLTELASPGDTIISAQIRDTLIAYISGDIEDLGFCYLKHVEDPIHLFRVTDSLQQAPADDKTWSSQLLHQQEARQKIQPTIAVVPFDNLSGKDADYIVGELLADGIIAQLNRTADLSVISRLSTSVIRNCNEVLELAATKLGANFVLSGSYACLESKLIIVSELTDVKSGEVVYADRLSGDIADLFEQNSAICNQIAELTHRKLMDSQVQVALSKPLPNLASYSLFLAGISGIHRAVPENCLLGQQALEQVIHRHPRYGAPKAWLAQWLAIRANRGLTDKPDATREQAFELAKRAVNSDPNSALSHTVYGLMKSFFKGDLDGAEDCYRCALDLNPNEHLAWLYRSTLKAWKDDSDAAVEAASRALCLSPLNPSKYYVESLAALPYLVAGQYSRAIELCESSIRSNRSHTASYRVLAAALVMSGDEIKARKTIQAMLILEPTMSVSVFLKRYAGRDSRFAPQYAQALQTAGLPLNTY